MGTWPTSSVSRHPTFARNCAGKASTSTTPTSTAGIHGAGDKLTLDDDGMAQFVPATDHDKRTVTLRTFSGEPGEPGILRAVLSDRAFLIDNFDVLTAALEGVREADAQITISACNLTETRMSVHIDAPSIAEAFPKFLEGYPPVGKGGNHYGTWPPVPGHPGAVVGQIISAGLVISNSETGGRNSTSAPGSACGPARTAW